MENCILRKYNMGSHDFRQKDLAGKNTINKKEKWRVHCDEQYNI